MYLVFSCMLNKTIAREYFMNRLRRAYTWARLERYLKTLLFANAQEDSLMINNSLSNVPEPERRSCLRLNLDIINLFNEENASCSIRMH